MTNATWTIAEPTLPARTHTYSFGPGLANTLAIPIEGGVAVVSPPPKPDDTLLADLEKDGPVKAIIAPNAFHTMGIGAWHERYPSVPVFAPAQSVARVEKQSKVGGIRPIAEAAALFGGKVEIDDMPHYKTGEVLVRWKVDGGWAWYLTDVIMNMPEVPKGLFGLLFRWSRSCPGLRRNAFAGMFMVKDKRALYAWLIAQAEKAPPRILVPCHGPVVETTDPVAEIRAAVS